MTTLEASNKLLDCSPKGGIAEVLCTINHNGQIKDSSILVITDDLGWDGNINDDQIDYSKHWYVCKSIDNFMNLFYTSDEFCHNFYGRVLSVADVRDFVTDF